MIASKILVQRFSLSMLAITSSLAATAFGGRDVRDFDADWKFALGVTASSESPEFDDASWLKLDVPHDWAFEADYAPDAAQADRGGYKPGGIGWYRKTFERPADWEGQSVRVDFDAVYMNSEVWINGHLLGKRPYGYISFSYDLTKYLRPGKNVIVVRVDNNLEPSARWYHGCGIYGHVKLVVTDPVHVAQDGVFVTTPQVSPAKAQVAVETVVVNATEQAVNATLETTVLDPAGERVAIGSKEISLKSNSENTAAQTFSVTAPKRWDIATPHLYRAVSRVSLDGEVVDECTTRFGIRTIRWDVATGFWLNERNVKLLGVCDHLEAGPVGAASPDELIRWKIQLLKDMGCKGYLDFGQNRGAFVQWYQENDGSAGSYDLMIRYSGKAKTRDGRFLRLTVNGKDIQPRLFLPNTSGYGTDWKTVTTRIQLERGANTIRLTTVENGGMYIDEMTVR